MTAILNFKSCEFMFSRFLCCIGRCLFRKRFLCVFCLVLITAVVTVFLISLYSFSKCSFDEVESTIFNICDKYQDREALGNICADICELKTLQPSKCLPNHLGKEVVFEAKHYDKHIVVKSSKFNFDELDQIFFKDNDGNQVYPTIDSFYSMVFNSVEKNLNISLNSARKEPLEFLTKMWTKNMKNFPQLPVAMQNVAMNNIWNLIQQTEYLLMKYYDGFNDFPKILGTCSSFYAVEFIQPLDNMFMVFYPVWEKTFYERAKIALKVIKFLENTEKHLPSLHICDVKVGHFGFDESGDIKLLDMDMVFFEPILIQNMVAIKSCTSDHDCTFIDCKGLCNESTKACEAKVVDNNFQRICNNLFAGKLVFSYFGLLSSPPRGIANKINSILNKCSGFLDDVSSHILASELKQILESSVADANIYE